MSQVKYGDGRLIPAGTGMEFYRKIKILEEVIERVGEVGLEGEYAPEYLVEAERRPIDGSLSMADREARACYAHVGGGSTSPPTDWSTPAGRTP